MNQRKALVEPAHRMSVRRQADLLEVCRSSLYYKPVAGIVAKPTPDAGDGSVVYRRPDPGVLGMQDELAELGVHCNLKRIRRLLRNMGIEPIYPKKNLSRLGQAKYVHPYLLRHVAIDISYIPMKKGFMYLRAITDLYSRYIVGWGISNSLEKETKTQVLEQAISKHGVPEIVNSDQGSQYTCAHWVDTLKHHHIHIRMDGKGRAIDNAIIERWFRTIKQKHSYLHPASHGLELYQGIAAFIKKYNRRRHQGIEHRKPIDLYLRAA